MNGDFQNPVAAIPQAQNLDSECRGLQFSKREFFAGLALAGLLTYYIQGEDLIDTLAFLAVRAADALIRHLGEEDE